MDSPDDRQRFEAVYAQCYAAVLSYVRRRSTSPDDAADAMAETFTTAWRKVSEIPAGDEARLWLYGVARRVLANQRRGESRRSALANRLRGELAVLESSRAEEPGDSSAADLREAFSRLSEEDRELLALIGWEGLSPAEAATVLGSSRGAVRIRLHRARKRLAKELDAVGLDVTRYGARAVALVEGRS